MLQGKALYGVIAAMAVVIVVLLGAMISPFSGSNSYDGNSGDGGQSVIDEMGEAYSDGGSSLTSSSVSDIPSISFDDSNPFWGVWSFASEKESEANSYASKLSNEGFSSNVVVSSDWSELDSETWYCVTTGSWITEAEANEIVLLLHDVGYTDAYSKYTGEYIDGINTVRLTVETASGETLSGIVHRDSSGYVIADSSSREYSVSELKAMGLTDAELCIAWNEPFARQGYHFKNPDLRAYFNSCSWYTDTGNSSILSGVAATNNSRLRQIAEESGSSEKWKNLATS